MYWLGGLQPSLRSPLVNSPSDPAELIVGAPRGSRQAVAFGMGDVHTDGNLCSLGSVSPGGVRSRWALMRRGKARSERRPQLDHHWLGSGWLYGRDLREPCEPRAADVRRLGHRRWRADEHD